VRVLDGEVTEVQGVGFAGVKGFAAASAAARSVRGGAAIKQFVQAAVDEALKLEAALARLRTQRASRAALLADPGDGRRASRSKSSRTSARAASRSRSIATA
jgi:hypothetical protein